jgi:hypothetical protein
MREEWVKRKDMERVHSGGGGGQDRVGSNAKKDT